MIGSLNPARSFGPCVVLKAFPTEHWIYWIGPILGTLVAVGFYRLVKMLEYETANPGQDFNEKEAENFNFDEDTARGSDIVRPIPSADGPSRRGTGELSSSGERLDSSGGRLDSSGGRLGSSGGRLDSSGGHLDSPGGRPNSNGGTNSPKIFHDGYREAPRIEEGSPRIESANMGSSYRPYSGA